MSTLAKIGEREMIRRLAAGLKPGRGVRVGVGDDAAVVSAGGKADLLLTSDPLIEGVHFRRGDAPERVGHKAVGRVLSDLAAMGGEPLWALINVAAPAATRSRWLEDFYRGAERLGRKHGLPIVGGDLARAGNLHVNVFAVGRAPPGSAVTRSGARPGDGLYVTGTLGGSRLGRHLEFEPRVREGCWLRRGGWVTAMIDLSDGLATDLRHLLADSRVGATVWRERVPVSRDAGPKHSRRAFRRALCDGEDFELLFTVPPARQARFEKAWQRQFRVRCVCIGQITARRNTITLVDRHGKLAIFTSRGFEHFRG